MSGLCRRTFENNQTVSPAESYSHPDEPASKKPKRTLNLTPSQRERKRAIDREAQRSIRLKTKNYIAHLESLVKMMENGGSTANLGEGGPDAQGQAASEEGEERVRGLLSQLKQSQDEVRRLREVISSVQRLVSGVLDCPADPNSMGLAFSELPTNGTSIRTVSQGGLRDSVSPLENCASAYSHSSDSSSPVIDFRPHPRPEEPRSAEASAARNATRSSGVKGCPLSQQDRFDSFGRLISPTVVSELPPSEPREKPKGKIEGELYFFSEREVNRALDGGQRSFANRPLDDDILVRAVLHGWRDVQDRILLDAGWQALRNIDQVIFGDCGIVERMAILQIMRLKLLHQGHSSPQSLEPLPPFHQRSSMEDSAVLARKPVIEHFIWPGFRSSLCHNDSKYITNHFADAFRRSFKFVWPHDISDIYVRDPATQLYSTAPEFRRRQADLRSWTMRREFFEGANELLSAIPVYEAPLGRTLMPVPSMSVPMALNGGPSHLRGHRQAPPGRLEEQEVEDLQPHMESIQVSAAAAPYHSTRVPVSVPVPVADVPVQAIPHSSEVEAWLGDADMALQYWNMSPSMNVGYGGQWSGVAGG